MKNLLPILLFALLFSCSQKTIHFTSKYEQKYTILPVPIVVEQDTTWVNELRFYKIKSAKDTQKLMFDKFGKWNEMLEGKYQENISQLVWNDRIILNDTTQFLIVADGTETQLEFFASVMIFDKKNNDCLSNSNPLRQLLVEFFASQMNNLSSDQTFYKMRMKK